MIFTVLTLLAKLALIVLTFLTVLIFTVLTLLAELDLTVLTFLPELVLTPHTRRWENDDEACLLHEAY
jgi:hypothetical protein